KTPEIYVPDVAGSATEERETELMRMKTSDLQTATVRHLFQNFVSTRFIDIVDSVALQYEPLIYDAETGDLHVQLARGADGELLYANESEERHCEALFGDGGLEM